MNGKLRAVWLILTAVSMLTFLLGGGVIYAIPAPPALSSHVTIAGPLELSLTLNPAVARPRDPVSLEVVLTNHQATVATPELLLQIPVALSLKGDRLPGGTSYSFQEHALSWLPVVAANGGTVSLQLEFVASVADLGQPAQPVELLLRYDGLERTTSADFWVGLRPVVNVGASPAVVAVGAPVQLTALTGGSGPFIQNWDLGDGRHLAANDPQVVYASPGTYRVTVRVANPLASATASAGITVVASPTAAFTVDDDQPVVAQIVQFVNQSGGQPPQTYRWDFGDGATSTEVNPAHEYSAPGNYVVRLQVESENGSAETSQTVRVGASPVLDFVIDSTASTGRTVYGQAYSDDSVNRLQWDMGDGRQYEGESVEHVYYRAGDFLVTVRGDNDYGGTEVSHWIHVEAGDYFAHLPLIVSQPVSPTAELAVGAAAALPVAPELILPVEPAPVVTAPAPPASDPPVLPVPVQPGGAAATGLPEPVAPAEPAEPAVQAPLPTEIAEPVILPEQSPLPPGSSPAEELLWYINEARRLHNLAPLTYNYELSIAAQMHTEDMVGNPDIMHQGSDGSTPAERQQRYGYQGYYGGEAVAWGWETAAPVVEFWVNSPPHRVLILDPHIREVGVGFFADGLAPNIWYWTAEFGYLPGTDPSLINPNYRPSP
jgi:uncharacterized protein YkwD/PKD repeat protein